MLLQGMGGDMSDKQSRYLDNISTSGKHLLNIINEILDISRIESGEMKLQKEKVAISEVCGEIHSSLKALADSKNIQFELPFVNSKRCVFADRAKLKQILYNLVTNAIKFTEEGGTVSLSSTVVDGFVQISVIDAGIGIDRDSMKMLFTPFMQLDSSEARMYEGTGLGLALSKELVELMAGAYGLKVNLIGEVHLLLLFQNANNFVRYSHDIFLSVFIFRITTARKLRFYTIISLYFIVTDELCIN